MQHIKQTLQSSDLTLTKHSWSSPSGLFENDMCVLEQGWN